MSTKQSTPARKFVSKDDQPTIRVGNVLISKNQMNQVIDKIFSEANSSVISGSQKKKTAMSRKCPLCEKTIGNFGPNYKNHFKKCCPVCIQSIIFLFLLLTDIFYKINADCL